MPIFDDAVPNVNPFGRPGDLLGFGRRARQPQFKPLPDAEAEAAKDSLVSRGVSGLTWIGQTLDKAFGARALRGLAVGDLNEAKSIIPFSDSLGITDVNNSHSMDDVLQHHGLVKPNNPDLWEARDFAVPALEIAADPGVYINPLGATTKLGQAAARAGALPKGFKAGMQGFHATEPALKALGHTDEAINFARNAGQRIAPEGVVDAAARAGVPDLVGKPLKGAVGFGLPFREPAFTLGHGPVAQKYAGALDAVGGAIGRTRPVAFAKGLFSPDAMRSFDPLAQEAAATAGRPAGAAVHTATDAMVHDARFKLEPIISGPGVPAGVEREANRLIRMPSEHAALAGDQAAWRADLLRRHGLGITPGIADPIAVADHLTTHWNTLADMGAQFRARNAEWLAQEARLGLPATDLGEGYFARQAIAVPHHAGEGATGGKVFGTATPSTISRKKFLRDIPGSTGRLDDFAIDPRLSGPNRTLAKSDAAAEILKQMHVDVGSGLGGVPLHPDYLRALKLKSRGLATYLGKLDPLHARAGIPLFDPDAIGMMGLRGGRQAHEVQSAAALYAGIGRAARPLADLAADGTEHVPVLRLLDRLGLKTSRPYAATSPADLAHLAAHGMGSAEEARRLITDAAVKGLPLPAIDMDVLQRLGVQGFDGAGRQLYQHMGQHGLPYINTLAGGDPLSPLAQFGIARTDADAMTRFLNGWAKPHEVGPILKRLDSANNLFKNMVYPLWPASHVRNLMSAIYNNQVHGTPIAAYMDAARVMGGKGVGNLAEYAAVHPQWATMTPEARSALLHQLAYSHGKVFQGAGGVGELVGRHGLEPIAEKIAAGERLNPRVPGDTSHIFGERGVVATARSNGAAALDPRQQAGVLGNVEDKFAPLVLGRRAGTNIEDYVRLSSFLGGLRKGMTPEVAGQLVNKVHFNYGDLTRFEKEVMRRVFPFYTFARKNLPAQVDMLAHQPGNLAVPLKALTNVDGGSENYTPDYLSSGVAIPMGEFEDPATGRTMSRYFNRVGLPFEEAFDRFRFTHNLPNPLATGRAFAAQATPYLKAPIEAMTDTQFMTGRKLSDLHSQGLWGGYGVLPDEVAQPLTQIMANSPLARVGTTADKIADDRKGVGVKLMNLLSGFAMTDVDKEKLRNVEARKELEAALARDPALRQFTNIYVRPGEEKNIRPGTADMMRLYTGMKEDAKELSDKRKAREKLQALTGRKGL